MKKGYKIPDHSSISKQYPKVMKYPKRHGFSWCIPNLSYDIPIRFVYV